MFCMWYPWIASPALHGSPEVLGVPFPHPKNVATGLVQQWEELPFEMFTHTNLKQTAGS